MTQVTDKMVKAFRREAESNKWDILNENGVQIGFNRDEATRAGIEAALSVAAPPSPMVALALNVELKSVAMRSYVCPCCGFTHLAKKETT